jgi:hypothetical protein
MVLAPLVDFYNSLLQLSSSRILFKYTSNRTKEFFNNLQPGQMGDSILFLMLGIFLLLQMLAVADILDWILTGALVPFIEEAIVYRREYYRTRQRQEALERNQVLLEDLVIPSALIGISLLFVFSAKI